MGRWEPDARGRLARAALALFLERGFERTTVAEIAQRAGLTESTFYRTFADKREVLFSGFDPAQDLLVKSITDAAPSVPPAEAVLTALHEWCTAFESDPEPARQRTAIVSSNADLRERDLTKHSGLAAAMAAALHERGTPERTALLTAESGLVVFRIAFGSWIDDPGRAVLPQVLRTVADELASSLAVGSPPLVAVSRASPS